MISEYFLNEGPSFKVSQGQQLFVNCQVDWRKHDMKYGKRWGYKGSGHGR